MAFDDIFLHIGSFGKFQIIHFIVLTFPSFYAGSQSLALTFLAPKDQDFWCSGSDRDGPDDCYTGGNQSEPCHSWDYDKAVYGDTLLSQYNMVCDRSYLIQLSYMCLTGASVVSAAVSGWLIDRCGRRAVAVLASWLQLICGIAEIYAPSLAAFITLRFFLFLFISFSVSACFVLVLELSVSSARTTIGPVYWISWSLGVMFTPVAAYWFPDYTSLQVVLVIPMFLSLFYCFILEESPRWLVAMGKMNAAEQTLTRIAEMNNKVLPLDLSFEDVIFGDDAGLPEEDRKLNLCDICKISKLLKQILLLIPAACACNLIYYGISFNTDTLPGSVYVTTFLCGVVEIPANLLIFPLMYRVGRQPSQAWTLIITGVSTAVCSIMIYEAVDGPVITILALLGKFFITMAFTVLSLYVVEMFPTSVRGETYTLNYMAGALTSLAAPFMGPPLEDIWVPLPFVVYGALALVAGLLIFFLPETLHSDLPETIEDAVRLANTATFSFRYKKLKSCT